MYIHTHRSDTGCRGQTTTVPVVLYALRGQLAQWSFVLYKYVLMPIYPLADKPPARRWRASLGRRDHRGALGELLVPAGAESVSGRLARPAHPGAF